MISCPGNARGMSSTEDISEKGRGENRAMIFCNTKKTCEQLEDGLNRARVRCDSIHGDKARCEGSMSRGRDRFRDRKCLDEEVKRLSRSRFQSVLNQRAF